MTAVQWFGEQTLNYLSDEQRNNLIEAFKQALELEKQQIVDAYETGYQDGDAILGYEYFDNSESYYNKTYKKDIK